MRGEYGPVALGSKLGYILSGPIENFKIMLRRTISLVFILCVLKQSSLIVIYSFIYLFIYLFIHLFLIY